jgi:hypothetical protein
VKNEVIINVSKGSRQYIKALPAGVDINILERHAREEPKSISIISTARATY